jgi:hypothetical protein
MGTEGGSRTDLDKIVLPSGFMRTNDKNSKVSMFVSRRSIWSDVDDGREIRQCASVQRHQRAGYGERFGDA